MRYTAEELQDMRRRGEDRTDWAKVDATTEQELAASIAADPDDVHEEPDWANAIKRLPPLGKKVNVPIDADVLEWFKAAAGRGYRTRINAVLRLYVEQRKGENRP